MIDQFIRFYPTILSKKKRYQTRYNAQNCSLERQAVAWFQWWMGILAPDWLEIYWPVMSERTENVAEELEEKVIPIMITGGLMGR